MTSTATCTPLLDAVSLADLDACPPEDVEAATAYACSLPKEAYNADACTELPDWQPRFPSGSQA